MEYTVQDIINALAQSEVHAADCPRGAAESRQKRTEMYVRAQDYECTCWVNNN